MLSSSYTSTKYSGDGARRLTAIVAFLSLGSLRDPYQCIMSEPTLDRVVAYAQITCISICYHSVKHWFAHYAPLWVAQWSNAKIGRRPPSAVTTVLRRGVATRQHRTRSNFLVFLKARPIHTTTQPQLKSSSFYAPYASH